MHGISYFAQPSTSQYPVIESDSGPSMAPILYRGPNYTGCKVPVCTASRAKTDQATVENLPKMKSTTMNPKPWPFELVGH